MSSIGEGLFLLQATHPSLSVGTQQASELPESFGVTPAWPNPFSGQVTLELDIKSAGALRVSVLDMLGRELTVLREGAVQAGPETIRFDGSGLTPGVYMVRLDLDGVVVTKPITRQ